MLAFLASVLLSFLPPRYRAWWRHEESEEMSRAALVSGFLQVFVCGLLFIVGFIAYAPTAGISKMAWLEYAFTPQGALLGYLSFEGLVRFFVALVSGEALGTLPLYVVAWVQGRAERARAERTLGPAVADRMERGDGREYDWSIATCRPKPNWDRLMTVAYQDELYEVVKEERGAKPRPYVYFLRKMPEGKVVRGLHHYDPNEPLQEQKE
ncbi:TMEM134 family protein [Acidobacteriia bacterium AH_259_A11_L15]|nr:TMEM134 family protein [Acidobacteriia bacterium AH_259_A11_L15]